MATTLQVKPTSVTKFHQATSTDPSVAEVLHQALVADQDAQQFSDFIVSVDDVEFKCHRFVLSARSGFFRSLFSSSMRETAEGKASLQRMNAEVFSVVLKWMYEGDATLTQENVFDVLFAADLLDSPCLVAACKRLLANILSLDNCVSIHHIAKVLNDEKLERMAFNFLLKEFDSVCGLEEFFKLSAEYLKALVSHSGLVTRSEDVVIENILKWVHAEVDSLPHGEQTTDSEVVDNKKKNVQLRQKDFERASESDDSTDVSTDIANLSMHEGTVSSMYEIDSPTDQAKHCSKHVTKTSQLENKQEKEEQRNSQLLADMLESTRYLLLSGNCLWQTLACDPLVQSDARCQGIVDAIVRYNTRLDIHQDAIRAPAAFRSSDQLMDGVLTCVGNTFFFMKIFAFLSIDLNCPIQTIQGLAYFENSIYIRNEKSVVFVYTPRHSKWEQVTTKELNTKTLAMMPIGNELIAITTADSETYTVESLSLKAHGPVRWDPIGEFITRGLEVASVTNIGSKLVVFWRQAGQNCLRIEWFDLVHRKSAILPDQLGSTSHLVTFKHDDEAFALQEDGSLWRVCVTEDTPYIIMKPELCLWNFHRAVDGAMLVRDDLVIFETTKKSGDDAPQPQPKNVCLDKVFKGIRFVKSQPTQTGYIHVALKRMN